MVMTFWQGLYPRIRYASAIRYAARAIFCLFVCPRGVARISELGRERGEGNLWSMANWRSNDSILLHLSRHHTEHRCEIRTELTGFVKFIMVYGFTRTVFYRAMLYAELGIATTSCPFVCL